MAAWWTSALKHCNALSAISLHLDRISLTSQRELLVKDFAKPHLGIFWLTSLKDKQKEKKYLQWWFCSKPAKLLTTRKNIASTSLNEKFKIRNLTFQNRYYPSSCFLSVFRNCIIKKRINVCIWQIVKLWIGRSNGVMTVVYWIYTTAITPQQWRRGGCFVTTKCHVVQTNQSENRTSYSVWNLNKKTIIKNWIVG